MKKRRNKALKKTIQKAMRVKVQLKIVKIKKKKKKKKKKKFLMRMIKLMNSSLKMEIIIICS